jgi:cation diffusion facilitator CzcD-associated flavoprotein CzcO
LSGSAYRGGVVRHRQLPGAGRARNRFDCFEVGSEVGGNWRYMNDNEMSSAYRSLHINTSRRTMAYATYPMPVDYPDYQRLVIRK